MAVAKLEPNILDTTKESEFAKILLYTENNKASDEFIEVHIYGGFNIKSIEAVCGMKKQANKLDRAILKGVIDKLKNRNIRWIEK